MLSGLIANRILHEGRGLMTFKVDAAGLILFALLVILAPLTVFTPQLVRAKRRGRREYGLLANQYVQQFHEKWVQGGAATGEALIGSADIQSLADMGSSYSFVPAMRPVPFGFQVATHLALITVAPLLPLALTVVSLEQLVDRIIKVLL